jgi:hypothetical protein
MMAGTVFGVLSIGCGSLLEEVSDTCRVFEWNRNTGIGKK